MPTALASSGMCWPVLGALEISLPLSEGQTLGWQPRAPAVAG